MTRNHLLAGAVLLLGSAMAASASAAEPFTLTSPSFADGTMLDLKNAGNTPGNPNCIGQNISPARRWSNVPPGTQSLVMFLFDPEGRMGLGVSHWVAYGIAPSLGGFAEGEVGQPAATFVGGKGTAGKTNYVGPCTPPGTGMHHYTFTLVATDLPLDALAPGMTRDEVMARLDGHAKGAAGLVGLFGRP